ncbi:helix-turn-helix domain-containing protein, partial [Actinomadura adrarensis]
MTDGPDGAPVSMIERVVRVLDTFDGATRLSLAQVVQRSGLPRSSTHRILDQLVAVRWLSREGNDYRLGIRMLELGSLAL